MAHDLLRGKTRRDWSCGIDLRLTQPRRREMAEDVLANREVGELGKLVDDEIQQSFREIARLHAAGKMPPELRRSFRPLLARWQEFKSARDGKLAGSDYLELANFRDENRRFAREIAAISAASPRSPASSETRTPAGSKPSLALGIAGLTGLCGLSILSLGRNKNHS